MENIVCFTPFSVGFILHPPGGLGSERHTETFEMELATLMETRNGTSDDFTNLILAGDPGGVTGDSSPALQPINTRNHAITLLFLFPLLPFFLKRVHNRYVIIFHLLALFNTLITISPTWAERKLLPPPKHESHFSFWCGVRTSLNSCEGKCPCLFSFSPLQSMWLLSVLVLKSWRIIGWWSLYRFSLCCALWWLLFSFFPPQSLLAKRAVRPWLTRVPRG